MYMPQLTETVRTVRKDHAAHIKGDSRPLPADQPVPHDGRNMRHPGKRRTDCPATSSKCSVTAIWTEDDRARHPPPAGRRHDPNPRWPLQARPRSGADAIQARAHRNPMSNQGPPHAAGTQCSPEPVREIKRARQYQQIMIRQRFIENTPHQRGGTSRFFHAHAYAENTSDIIVVGRTAMSRTRHRAPPPDHCHGCHSSHATHAIDMRTKQGGSSNRDVIPEGRQRPGEGQGRHRRPYATASNATSRRPPTATRPDAGPSPTG